MRVGISTRDALWSLGSGLLGAAAFPPVGLWPMALISLFLFLRTIASKNPSEARAIGLLYGFAFGLGTMYWLFGLFGVYALVLIVIMANYFVLLASLIAMTRESPAAVRALAVAIFAMAVEWFRGDAWYLRFPWYTPPHALAQSPIWISSCHWIGTYGLSGLVWGIAAWTTFGKPYFALAYLVLPVGSFILPAVEPPNQSAVLVQCEDTSKLEPLLSAIPTEQVDLVVLPEYAYPYGIDTALKSKHGPVALAKRLACPVIFGTVDGTYGAPNFQNVAAVLDDHGNLVGTFPKQRPVPLMVDGRPGDRRPVFPFSIGTLGIGLCYDFDAPAIAGSLTAAGATILVAPTGDLIPWGRVQHTNHELLVRLRAVENDRWVLRATTSGRSEAVDPHGVPSKEHLEFGETGKLVVSFASRTSFALGGRLYFLGPLAGGVTLLFLLWNAWLVARKHRAGLISSI
ncbi:MAG TPA: nitrilase-related carbon-nitrogen hydrolase [Gemmataceae bacterium]|jgi:apolipoprotein N-acyltransferase|nr:nitrilase-related carbon-nitrogen hydrolase [Gemmataceae bacterium]